MNQYLEVLGLKPGVSEKGIKDAYRKLVKIYHPDVNKDPGAAKKFIEISEAYKFLLDVGARPHEETVSYDYNPFEDEYSKWREKAKAFARKKKEDAEAEYRRILLKIFKYFDYAAYLILIMNLAWTIDYILPYKTSEEKFLVKENYFMGQGRGPTRYTYDILHFENHKIMVEKGTLHHEKEFNGTATLYATLLFDTVVKISLKPEQPDQYVYPVASIYRFFGFLIPLIFLVSGTYFRWTQVLENKFAWAILLLILFFFQLKIY